jgi:uncharacterized protein
MKPPALLLSLFLLLPPVCLGQQTAAGAPASKEDVMKLFEVMHIRDMMKQVMDIAMKQSRQLARSQMKKDFPNMPPDQAAQMDRMMDDMFSGLPIEQLLQNMVPVYQKHFTKGDMDAILAFYSSSSGQKFIKETPAITQESMQASYGLLQQYMQTTMQKVRQRAEQMQKDAKPTQPSSPKPN